MKNRNYRIISIIAAAIFLVCLYQFYWLAGQYMELRDRLQEDIQEVLRSSDFEELAHRVDEISRMDFQGKVDVRMGYDHEEKNTLTKSEINDNSGVNDNSDVNDPNRQTGTHTVVSPSSFGDVLKKPEDLFEVGLNMQRGIHLSLDAIKEVDFSYLNSLITLKLDSLGLNGDHKLLYIKDSEKNLGANSTEKDTLAEIGDLNPEPADIFTLKISDDSEYQMIIPRWHNVILKKMIPIILFSIVTLLLLGVTFIYLIHILRKQRELEEIKTDFTNNITHELRTPIAVAYAANDALLNFDSANYPPRIIKYLTICQDQLRLLDRLVEQILSLSMERTRPLLLNIEEVAVKEIFNDLAKNFRFKYPNKVSFLIDARDDLTLRTDRMHLSNIISNLVDNAIKYSEGEACVTMRAYSDKRGQCVIEIADNGIGISEEQQKHIFDKFYRVPHGNIHNVKGYGLGLFYVKSMMDKLGAAISVKSALGKGSCFKLIFMEDTANE